MAKAPPFEFLYFFWYSMNSAMIPLRLVPSLLLCETTPSTASLFLFDLYFVPLDWQLEPQM
jgi:hypothetical protein